MENYKQKEIINSSILNIIWYYVVSILGSLVISLLIGMIPAIKNQVASGDTNMMLLLTNLFTYVVISAVLYLINRKKLKEDLKSFNLKQGIKLILLGFVAVWISNVGLSMIYQLAGLSESVNQQALTEVVTSGHFLISFIFMVLLGPISEEIIFRYSFINIINYSFRNSKMTEIKRLHLANIIASLFFGLIHVISGGDFIFLPLYMALGLVIGIFYIKSNQNLVVSSGIHILNNLLAFAGMIIISIGA